MSQNKILTKWTDTLISKVGIADVGRFAALWLGIGEDRDKINFPFVASMLGVTCTKGDEIYFKTFQKPRSSITALTLDTKAHEGSLPIAVGNAVMGLIRVLGSVHHIELEHNDFSRTSHAVVLIGQNWLCKTFDEYSQCPLLFEDVDFSKMNFPGGEFISGGGD